MHKDDPANRDYWAGHDAGHEAGGKAERAAIVAWLRHIRDPEPIILHAYEQLASSIEAGEHLSYLKGNEG